MRSLPELRPRLPTFVKCVDGKWYEDLVYQDHPASREWFICFSDKEPAELVLRESAHKGGISAHDVLVRRGFKDCVRGPINGRMHPHLRFFGCERNVITGEEKPVDGHRAISWWLVFKKGVALPTPDGRDACTEIYPYYPNKPGVYFGE